MTTWAFWRDLADRTGGTYAVTFLGLLVAGWTDAPFAPGLLESAGWAAVPAALTVLKCGLASRVGDRDSGALLPGPKLSAVVDLPGGWVKVYRDGSDRPLWEGYGVDPFDEQPERAE